MKRSCLALSLVALGLAGTAAAQDPEDSDTVDRLERSLKSLKAERHIWRAVPWSDCLLEGVARARKEDKPILLWMFLHNPKDERC